MRHHQTFDNEADAQAFASTVNNLVTVYQRPTLYAMGEVFERGCWAVSWIEYTP